MASSERELIMEFSIYPGRMMLHGLNGHVEFGCGSLVTEAGSSKLSNRSFLMVSQLMHDTRSDPR